MIASIKRQVGITKLEWIILALIILIGPIAFFVAKSMYLERERELDHIETVSIPLIEALGRYRAANKSYPDALEKLVPTYVQELPGCISSPSPTTRWVYNVDKDSGEYFLNCDFKPKWQYSSKTKGWYTQR